MGRFYDPAVPFNLSIWEDAVRDAPQPNVDFNAASSEDCLFLDVHVPKTVLESAGKASSKSHKKNKGAAVLVWVSTTTPFCLFLCSNWPWPNYL